ncbi:sialate O-acetylesterase [Gaetbulibacter aquiaggeris]|uniref:Sialate O-acetylesterase n=1 Tax=Gaetbulibacter aquiaggeris TaxID=1735373 RepID=A0ABW7ML22_9FLAO
MRTLVVICNLLICCIAFSQNKSNTFKLFYLGGQSNMDGFGYNKDLPDSLNTNFDDVYIFHGNPAIGGELDGGLGIWEQLKPGHGEGFSSDNEKNNLSERFGLELSFAKKMKALFPNDKIAIIKYSRGGTSIDSMAYRKPGCWEPDFNADQGINQYDHFLATLRNAFKDHDIDNDGMEDVLVPEGIVWMQGEADTDTKEIAERYLFNLKRLMDLIRASLLTDDLPIVIGKISDSWDNGDKVYPYEELVQYAQEEFVKMDKNSDIVRNSRYYKFSDRWHYDSQGFIDLGSSFAEKLYGLIIKNSNK